MSFRSYDLLKLVEDHGQSLTLRKITTEGSYNPSTGSTTGSVTTDYASIITKLGLTRKISVGVSVSA